MALALALALAFVLSWIEIEIVEKKYNTYIKLFFFHSSTLFLIFKKKTAMANANENTTIIIDEINQLLSNERLLSFDVCWRLVERVCNINEYMAEC